MQENEYKNIYKKNINITAPNNLQDYGYNLISRDGLDPIRQIEINLITDSFPGLSGQRPKVLLGRIGDFYDVVRHDYKSRRFLTSSHELNLPSLKSCLPRDISFTKLSK